MHSLVMTHHVLPENFELSLLSSCIVEPLLDRVIADLTHLVQQTQEPDRATIPKEELPGHRDTSCTTNV